MDEINLDNLNIDEEEALNFDLEENSGEKYDVNLCMVGRFIHDRPIKFNIMKARLADVWRPVKGMVVKEATQGLHLFQFFHPLDVEEVMKGGPWLFDNYTLVIDRMKVGVALHDIPLYRVNFWVQIHNVPVGMMLEKVGKGLANYIGEFVEYDKNNSTSFWRQYMRVKYERLGLFCFVCGVIGHSDNKCEVKYAMERDDGSRGWSNEIKAEVRRPGGRVESRWLREERSSMGGVHTDCHARQRESQSSGSSQSNETQPRPSDNGSDSYQGGNEVVVAGRNITLSMSASMGSLRPNHELSLISPAATSFVSHRPTQVGNAIAERSNAQISHLDDNEMEFPGLPGLMIILSWNCRGLGGPSAIPNLKKLAQGHKPDILFLSETLSYTRQLESIRVMLGFDSCLAIDVEGRSGGLAVFWKDSMKDDQWGEWRLTCYYGFPERSRRRAAWDLLRELRNMSSIPWCIIGDFNDLLSQADKKGIHPHPNGLCMGFKQAFSDCDLTDIPIEGHPFTWIKNRGTPHVIEERLDRAMTSASWLQLFPQVRLSNLLASHSDHNPILLQCKPVIRTHISYSFRFENSWLKESHLEDLVVEGWGGRENLKVVDRVKRCANKLQRWGKRKRVRFKEEIDECVRRMNELRGNQDGEVSLQYQELSEKHVTLLIQEEGYWKQRAKMHWLQEGDMKTRFFHMSATARSKKKKVTKLVADNGTEAHTQETLCEVAKSYFDNLFKPRDGDHDPFLNLIQPRVTDDDNFFLTAPITKVEVQQALFQMHPDKSPGPDGFNPAFYQRFWEHCSDDIFSDASTWLERGYFPTSLNETNICLIPKCDNPTLMKDLRPISLCNVLYKMISKVLANRLKCCLDKCVSQEQSAFVEGRSILDNVIIATEVIHALKRKTQGRRGELALKIDISKAYDKVDWGFLRGVMTKMRFTDVWIRWVMMCVGSVNYSVLMNYDRVGPISPGRGLRQGDPLSPYLFILVTECLTALIYQSVGRGDIHGVRICRGAPEVSHLLFADDCFLFCRANVVEVNELMRILHSYEQASGQEINLVKSEVFISRNMSHATKEDLSRILGVRLVLGTGIYLGLPSMVGKSKKAIFSFIKDRIWKRINSWRGRALSKAGKEIMIKSVLQAIPSYVMSMFILPTSLIDDIEKMINAFWWRSGTINNNNNNNKGIHWLAWERLACPKARGGLGFRNFEAFNKAMVAKQAPLGYNPSFAWRSMWHARQILSLGCRWRIGSGENIRVMHEPWLRGKVNKWVSSPQPAGVYQLFVRDLLHENYKAWNIAKVRNMFSGDVAERILETPLVHSVREDKVVWEEERNGCYSVKSGYKLAMRYIIGSDKYHVAGNWNGIWKAQAAHKARHLLWRLCRGCLPTRYRLLERRVECNLNCPVCDEEIEDEIHIFFSNESSDIVGRVVMLLWCIWKNRNDKLWNDNVQTPRQIGRYAFDAWNDWYSVHKLQSNSESRTTEADLVRWEKPALGWVKCNVDVAFVPGYGRTSVGLCFRNNRGQVMADITHRQQTVMSSVEGEA
ncbi:hypothetical protein TSUD_362450 [Trifolium subterraneum]|uniref:Reverse transcriptase domain-containing protein n=1 Tax=Trifolium subterraneum TaxID=3900 RepID=A0A2Z6NL18_TRISU|nr:hypothetical protein TSUD_362450 [Trifolium subterraneum]